MNAINTFLRENWQRFNLSRFGDGNALSSVLLTPGFQASSHIIAFVLSDALPTAKMVVKLPRIPGDHARLDIEAANLRYLFDLRKTVFPGTPEVLAYDNWHGHKMLVETMVPGSVLRPATARANFDSVLQTGRDWLMELHTTTKIATETLPKWRDTAFDNRFNVLATSFILTPQEQVAIEKGAAIGQSIKLPELVFEHGDFSAPNLLLHNGQLGAVDWELADPHGLPMGDFIFFLTFLAFAKNGAQSLKDCVSAFEQAFFSPGWAMPHLRQFAEFAGIHPSQIAAVFAMCWMRYLSNMLSRLRGDNPNISAQTAAWLRGNRYYHFWLMAIERMDELRG